MFANNLIGKLGLKHPVLCLLALGVSSLPAGAAQTHLPLETGNTWTYRDNLGTTFTVQVGLPAHIDNKVYYSLSGYVNEKLWVRFNENGNLYYRNEELDREEILTGFEFADRAWFEAPFRDCPQQSQVQEKRENVSGPAGNFLDGLKIQYRTLGCADAGFDQEIYVENVGLVRRSVITIAGPRVFELVSAKVGNTIITAAPQSTFQVALSKPKLGEPRLHVDLRLIVEAPLPLELTFPSTQRFDLQLRNSRGEVLYTWSADKLFAQVIETEHVQGVLQYEAEIPLSTSTGQLPPGKYTVEGWLTAGESGRQFSATAVWVVPEAEPAVEAQAATRWFDTDAFKSTK